MHDAVQAFFLLLIVSYEMGPAKTDDTVVSHAPVTWPTCTNYGVTPINLKAASGISFKH